VHEKATLTYFSFRVNPSCGKKFFVLNSLMLYTIYRIPNTILMIKSNEQLIKELTELGYLKSSRLIEAFEKIDRINFISDELKDSAYVNEPLPIGFGQTISQPLTVAFMLELLDLKRREKVLEIGSGSGWQTALIAFMIEHPGGITEDEDGLYGMVAIERIPELKKMTEKNVSHYSFIERGVVKVIEGDGSRGREEDAPYDKIIAAAAGNDIPKEWKEQLRIGGKIVAPVKNSVVLMEKTGKNEFEKKEFFGFSFVPLVRD